MKPLIIGHRGASALAPENTYSAVELARDVGADGVEVDIQMTADDQVLLFHDNLCGRLGHPTLAVHDRPLSFWLTCQDQGSPPATLLDILPLINNSFQLCAEIKAAEGTTPEHNQRLVKETLNQLTQANVIAHTRLLSFHPDVLRWSRQHNPHLRTVLDIEHVPTTDQLIHLTNLSGLSPGISILEEATPLAQERQLELATWTVNDDVQLATALKCKATLILTDRPDWLKMQLS